MFNLLPWYHNMPPWRTALPKRNEKDREATMNMTKQATKSNMTVDSARAGSCPSVTFSFVTNSVKHFKKVRGTVSREATCSGDYRDV